jgi:anti-sigma factor RsiW
MTTCHDVSGYLSCSLDDASPGGELSADERTLLNAHLAACPDCVRELRALHSTRNLVGELRLVEAAEADAAPALPEFLVSRMLAARAAEDVGGSRAVRGA